MASIHPYSGNRHQLIKRLSQLANRNDNEEFALLIVKIVNFFNIDASYGIDFSSQVHSKLSEIIDQCLRWQDEIYVLSEDQFAVILNPVHNQEHSLLAANKISNKLQKIKKIGGNALSCSVNIGISVYPSSVSHVKNMINSAFAALKTAKHEDEGIALSALETTERYSTYAHLQNEFVNAVQNNELELYYQPQIDLRSMKIVGVEALTRWNSVNHGMVSPSIFIPMAENINLINDLTRWSLNTALRECAKCIEYDAEFTVSLNFSPTFIREVQMLELVHHLVKVWGFQPQQLVFEITENILLDRPERILSVLKQLRQDGFNLSIDDFGTGYSSMNYLKTLPINELKIDKGFVLGLGQDDNEKLVKSIIDLAHHFNCKIVAEGIENELVLTKLRTLKVDVGQGFYFAKPMPIKDLLEYMDGNHNREIDGIA